MNDLFDFADDEPDGGEKSESPRLAPDDDQPDWEEVPQARFLSWSPAMQFAYCAARDEDAACRATTLPEFEWFMARAKSYRELSRS